MKRNTIALGTVSALSALLSGSAIAADTIEEQQRRGLELAQSLSPKQDVRVRFIDDRTASATVRIPLRDFGVERVTTTAEAIDVATSMIALLEPLYDTDTRTLVVQKVTPYGEGFIVGFTQRFGDVDVVGAHLRVLIDDDAVQGIVGRALGDEVGFAGRFDADDAVEIAVASRGGGHARLAPTQTIVAPTFIWSDAERAAQEIGREPRGAWRVVVESHPNDKEQNGGAVVFVDAHSGQVLLTSTERRDIDIRVRGDGTMWGIFCWSTAADWFNEVGQVPGSRPSPNGTTAATALRGLHSIMQPNYGRLSWDDNDGQLNALVDMQDANVVDNAFWDPACRHALFSPTRMASDIVAHEFGHAMTSDEVGFVYAGQSGALDEHWGDFNGVMLDNNGTIGEFSGGGTIRDMQDPPRFGDPDRFNDFVVTTADNGGVHSNSGILNKAAALLIFGGQHNGYTIQRVPRGQHAPLWWAATSTASSTETFQQWADFLLLLSDNAQHTSTGLPISARTRCDIRNAIAAVDLAASDYNCDGVVDPRGDRDNDGHGDEVDNCPDDFNFGQADWDGDGRGNVCDDDDDNDGLLDGADNCPGAFNPEQRDTLGDRRGDACSDIDDDWITDADDNCPTTWNGGQEDSDGDGIGDACEVDSDGDGIDDDVDNCRLVPNRFQDDTDRDGIGDSCDFCWYTPGGDVDTDGDGDGDVCDDDIDGDGFSNEEDNCPNDANTIQIDVDGDGSGDVCDQLPTWAGERLEVIIRGRDEWFSRHISTFDPCFSGICDLEVESPLPPPHGGLIVVTEVPVFARVLDGKGNVLAVAGPSNELALEWVTADGLQGEPSLELWRQEPGGGDLRAQIMSWR